MERVRPELAAYVFAGQRAGREMTLRHLFDLLGGCRSTPPVGADPTLHEVFGHAVRPDTDRGHRRGHRHRRVPGFDELGEALASRLGVKLEVGWVVFPNQIGRVDCDIVLDAIVDQASASERHVKLSRPYLVSGVAIALRPGVSGVADYADLKKGQRVGAIVGSAASVTLGQKGLPTIPFTFEDEMIEAVGKGELDAALATPASIGYYNLMHKDAAVTLVRAYENQPELRWEIAVGMRKSDDALVAKINEAIDRLLADGTVSRIYASYGIEASLPKGP